MRRTVSLCFQMQLGFGKNKFLFILLAVMLLCELCVDPLGEFPLNDDWSYARPVLNWLSTGIYNIGEWPAMTLFTHLLWGLLFTKVGGFSFFVLRLSTIVSAFIGVWTMFLLLRRVTANQLTALFGALLLLFNPLYFCLGNTYMTDVNFVTLLTLCCYFASMFFEKPGIVYFLLLFLFSGLLVFTRQFGLIVPFTFVFTCLFLKQRRWLYFSLALAFTGAIYAGLKWYENYLHGILPQYANYIYSGSIDLLKVSFWDGLYSNFKARGASIVLHVLIYTMPLSLLYLPKLLVPFNFRLVLPVGAVSAALAYFAFRNEIFPVGNVFYNMGLGTESFFESLSPNTKRLYEHTNSQAFGIVLSVVKWGFATVNIFCMILGVIKIRTIKSRVVENNLWYLFVGLTGLAYFVSLLISDFYFDRYHLPLIVVLLLLLSRFDKYLPVTYTPAVLLLCLFFYVSVFGTKDYLSINRKRWEAYNYLVKEKKVDLHKINAGFEPNVWNEQNADWWHLSHDGKQYDYLIQYWQEPGYRPFRKYPFRRYFPFKNDTVVLFIREGVK